MDPGRHGSHPGGSFQKENNWVLGMMSQKLAVRSRSHPGFTLSTFALPRRGVSQPVAFHSPLSKSRASLRCTPQFSEIKQETGTSGLRVPLAHSPTGSILASSKYIVSHSRP